MNERSEVLVTGGAGFIGSHLAEALSNMGHRVTVLDDLSGGIRENVPEGCEFVQGSVVNDGLVRELFSTRRFEVVFHLAAYAAEGLSHFIRRFNYENNVVGSVTVLNAAIRGGVRRFVFTSSIAVYGSVQTPMTEATTPRPEDPYGIAKYAVEMDLQAAAEMFGIEYVIFRPHNVYGERQNICDPSRNVVAIFMSKALRGEPMPVFGDGAQTRAFSYIEDVAPIIARGGFEPGAKNRIFNVGADVPVRVIDLARTVAEVFEVQPRIAYLPARHEVMHAFSDHSAVRAVFGESRKTPMREGLTRMAAWVRIKGPQERIPFTGIEVASRLPETWATLLKR